MKKNVAGQSIAGQMITAADGSDFTGTVTAYYTGDDGTRTIGSVSSGVCVHKGNGEHTYAPSQGETNFEHIVWSFIGTGALSVSLNLYTTFPQTADHTTAIADIPTVAEFNARTRLDADYFSWATDAVANVTLVATTTINSDMRGTDSAALASALATAQNDLDTITGADGAILLSGTQASIDAIEVDTGTDIPARFDGIEGATFATGTDSLEAIRNRGDAAWLTATDVALTATGLDAIASTATGMVEISKAVWDRIISKANHNIGQSSGKVLRQSSDLVQIDGAVNDVTPSVSSFDTTLTQPDGYFEDAILIFSNGSANAGIGQPVTGYLNANGNISFLAPDVWPVTPIDGDDFVIYATHVHPISQIQESILSDATPFQGADIAAILEDSAEIGTAGAGLTDLGGMSSTMKGQINFEMVDTLNVDTYAEPTGVPSATASIVDKLGYVTAKSRNKLTQTSTTQIIRNDGDTGAISTATVSDDGTTYIKAKDV